MKGRGLQQRLQRMDGEERAPARVPSEIRRARGGKRERQSYIEIERRAHTHREERDTHTRARTHTFTQKGRDSDRHI